MSTFRALVISQNEQNQFVRTFQERSIDDLPLGEVLIQVCYSTLNYKDALSSIGNKGVTRQYPHTPGIDVAGIVASSQSPDFRVGDEVVVTSYDLGMNTSGGFAEYVRVPASWVLKLPEGLTMTESMILGTAGLTAGLCIEALLNYGITADMGKVVVTGSTGGVGALAVAILAKLGFEVVAITGKPEAVAFLQNLGAKTITDRETLNDQSSKPLLKSLYAGGVDVVGGNMLATLLKSLQPNGAVACCGLVASPTLNTTVFPFILRGNALFGIDSAECAMPKRKAIWQQLSTTWKPTQLAQIAQEISLEEVPTFLDLMLEGKIMGKVLVKIK